MTRLAVEFDQLETFIADLASFERAAAAMHAELDARMRQVQGQGAGEAAAAHQRVQQRWAAGAGEMRAAVAQLRAIAATAHANYASAAQANQRMWSC